MTEEKLWDGPWAEVYHAINEIEWFAIRKKDLAEEVTIGNFKTWAEVMLSDLKDLRDRIVEARKV